jgi:hypothetical protein
MEVLSSKPYTDNKVQETPLLQVFNLDEYNNDRQTGGDGFMILSLELYRLQNGRIIFTTKDLLENFVFKLKDNNATDVSVYNILLLITKIKRNVLETCTVAHSLSITR